MTEFKLPNLGEGVEKGDVLTIMVKVGDRISQDQPILELETDKATIEVPSSVAGVVKEIRVKKGDKVKVGAVVLTVDTPASGNGDRAAAAKTPPPDAARSLDAPPAAAPQSAPAPAQASASSRVVPMPVRPFDSAQGRQMQEPAPAPAAAPPPPARADGHAAPARTQGNHHRLFYG